MEGFSNKMDHEEIERSWVISELPPENLIYDFSSHVIFYLISDEIGEARVIKFLSQAETKYKFSVKTKGGLVRKEWDSPYIPEWVYNILSTDCPCGIKKTRYFVDYKNHKLEIDKYEYRIENPYSSVHEYCLDKDFSVQGKIKLECEFNSIEESKLFTLPDWVKNPVEVTEDFRYKNCEIAFNGWPKE